MKNKSKDKPPTELEHKHEKPPNLNRAIKETLRHLRKSKKLTQKQLAAKLGYGQDGIHYFESLDRSISLFTLGLYSVFFGLPVSEIIKLAEARLEAHKRSAVKALVAQVDEEKVIQPKMYYGPLR